MDKKEALQILDEIDTLRRRSKYNPQESADYYLRVVCAIIAQKAGFTNRLEWCDALRSDTKTEYAKYYHFYPCVNLKAGKAHEGDTIKEGEKAKKCYINVKTQNSEV